MLKLSKTSKLGCLSWSLQAVETCPGARKDNGALVDACAGCYATTGAYLWGPTIRARASNKEDWKRDGWVQDMVHALRNQTRFRWFDSGDLYNLRLAEKVLEVMEATPGIKHWLPTRMHKFTKFERILKRMAKLPNVAVRASSDAVDGSYTPSDLPGVLASTIVPKGVEVSAFVCGAYTRGGVCGDCRACWDKDVPVIAYVAHGHKMAKVIRLQEVK